MRFTFNLFKPLINHTNQSRSYTASAINSAIKTTPQSPEVSTDKPLAHARAAHSSDNSQEHGPVVAAFKLFGAVLCVYSWSLIILNNIEFQKQSQARLSLENTAVTELPESIDSNSPRARG